MEEPFLLGSDGGASGKEMPRIGAEPRGCSQPRELLCEKQTQLCPEARLFSPPTSPFPARSRTNSLAAGGGKEGPPWQHCLPLNLTRRSGSEHLDVHAAATGLPKPGPAHLFPRQRSQFFQHSKSAGCGDAGQGQRHPVASEVHYLWMALGHDWFRPIHSSTAA